MLTRPAREPAGQNIIARNRFAATAITVGVGGLLIFSGKTMSLWKIFGSANQLLAALAMMAVTAWLSARKKKTWFTFIPMVIMYLVSVSALIFQFVQVLQEQETNWALLALVVLLFVLALLLAYNYVRHRLRE